ncbi:modular serine protease-like [Cardiocondyla obscurior]|uniref:modular serine protease-like n=1 Tax=Cardiocondyla obscurior TaxID=286306 RepID=UPI0039657F3F
MIVLAALIVMILVINTHRFAGYNRTHATEEESGHSSSTFVCVDGTVVPLANICDGISDCPDSSDEVGTLCRHVVCPTYMYRCNYGACVSRTARCDGLANCVDASDEVSCDQDASEVCSDRNFQCSVYRECIPIAKVCNGYKDCFDGSDENATICREYTCPEHTFRCSYGGCVHQEVVCDTIKDCVDGTDEDSSMCTAPNCQDQECSQCQKEEFACENRRQCIPMIKVCDGTRHCADASDESARLCETRECPENWFRCAYGGCIRPELKCNSQLNCHDWSDEDENLCGLTLPDGACRLPAAKAGVYYRVSGCSRCRPGEVVPEFTRLDYFCDVENSLQGAREIYCQSNQWYPAIPSCAFSNETEGVTCPALTEVRDAVKRCEAMWGPHEGWLSCDRALPVGTRVFLECPTFYERRRGSSSVVCLHDGTWSQSLLSCVPICGRRDSAAAALIVRGWSVEEEETLPWQATLFSHEDGRWKFFCGGSLIAERIVMTAGHCVWKTAANTMRVAFGIFSSDLNQVGETAQVIDVESIELQSAYQDHESNYGSDIALLILRRPVVVNLAVGPVCVPRNSDAILHEYQQTGGLGLVAGMGLTENDTFSSALRVTTMKIISDNECRRSQNRDFRKYITYTSFCAGWANGTGVCNGDSGGGLVLQRPNSSVWEVHGVVSVSPRKPGTSICDPNFYAVFTKVSVYANWIHEIIENIPVIGLSDFSEQPNRDNIII